MFEKSPSLEQQQTTNHQRTKTIMKKSGGTRKIYGSKTVVEKLRRLHRVRRNINPKLEKCQRLCG